MCTYSFGQLRCIFYFYESKRLVITAPGRQRRLSPRGYETSDAGAEKRAVHWNHQVSGRRPAMWVPARHHRYYDQRLSLVNRPTASAFILLLLRKGVQTIAWHRATRNALVFQAPKFYWSFTKRSSVARLSWTRESFRYECDEE